MSRAYSVASREPSSRRRRVADPVLESAPTVHASTVGANRSLDSRGPGHDFSQVAVRSDMPAAGRQIVRRQEIGPFQPGGPGFPPGGINPKLFELPRIVEPFPLGPAGARGVTVAAESGLVAGEAGTAVAVSGAGAATVAIVIVGGLVVGAALAVGVPFAIEHARRLSEGADPDEVSLPGGAPPQTVPMGDGDAGAPPMVVPGQVPAPATDPSVFDPALLPGQPTQSASMAADPKTGDPSKIVSGPPPGPAVNIAGKIPSAAPAADVTIGKVTKKAVTIDGGVHIGGDAWGNKGADLPSQTADGKAITYTEYDVNPYTGANRGAERLVIGTDQSRYYTNDHYKTFVKF
jgi:hypothetical protein